MKDGGLFVARSGKGMSIFRSCLDCELFETISLATAGGGGEKALPLSDQARWIWSGEKNEPYPCFVLPFFLTGEV